MNRWTEEQVNAHNKRIREERLRTGTGAAGNGGVKSKEPAPTAKYVPAEISPYRSDWEKKYAKELEIMKRAGEIQDWMYEPLKLKLHSKTVLKNGKPSTRGVYYIPDFMVISSYDISLIEIKGFMRKSGELKYYEAVEKFPDFTWCMKRYEKGGWVNLHFQPSPTHKLILGLRSVQPLSEYDYEV